MCVSREFEIEEQRRDPLPDGQHGATEDRTEEMSPFVDNMAERDPGQEGQACSQVECSTAWSRLFAILEDGGAEHQEGEYGTMSQGLPDKPPPCHVLGRHLQSP